MTKPLFNRITIIGLGLIGSSIARGARERGLAAAIVGCDPNEVALAYGRQHGFIDVALTEPAEAVAGSELIILATPPSTLGAIAQAIGLHLQPGAIVMDVCSVKEMAIAAVSPHIPAGVDFIPAHPIAGSEQSGIGAGRGDLFERKAVLVTPDAPTETPALQKVTSFWKALGARVEAMPAPLHDLIYAHVSHLPQLLAFAVSKPLAAYKDDERLQAFLRISGSNPALWTEIFLANKGNVIKALDRYLDAIAHIKSELIAAPADSLSENDALLACTVLFPRIAASCLITTVMEAEKLAGFSFGRYAGAGFADFTSPAAPPPEGDIERISGQSTQVVTILNQYIGQLKEISQSLKGCQDNILKKQLLFN